MPILWASEVQADARHNNGILRPFGIEWIVFGDRQERWE
jgi:hypothetical protein